MNRKNTFASLLLLVGCTSDPVPVYSGQCSPTEQERLLSDSSNCGLCGNVCDESRSNICSDGECRCGTNPSCSELERCVYVQPQGQENTVATCLLEEREIECETDTECPDGQTCSTRRDGRQYCGRHCETDSSCSAGNVCINSVCSFAECVQENCDGRDNDCDGRVDESDSGGPLARFCLDGWPTEPDDIIEPCMPGVQICLPTGTWTQCFGDYMPETYNLMMCLMPNQ